MRMLVLIVTLQWLHSLYVSFTSHLFSIAYVCLRLKLACSSHQEIHFLKCKYTTEDLLLIIFLHYGI